MSDQLDRWAQWLLHDRFSGDDAGLRRTLKLLAPVRDRVLSGARLGNGDVVLDVGCGDGLIGFGALDQVGSEGRVVFADISEQLLDRCQEIAGELNTADRCSFVCAPAETLAGIDTSSVDVVTTRSVLIYVDDKSAAFDSFRRVLAPGGRLSVFEPINRRYRELNQDTLFGYDAAPVADLATKVRAVFDESAPPDGPMMGFDETDLLRLAEDAGLADITVWLELSSTDEVPYAGVPWDRLLETKPNPNAPSFGDAIDRALTSEEAATLESYLRPRIDSSRDGRYRSAQAYLTATRR